MNRVELFWYELGKYRGISEYGDDNYGSGYLNFIEHIYDIFSGFGKIHQYFLDTIVEQTINEDGEILVNNEEEYVDEIVEYFQQKVIA